MSNLLNRAIAFGGETFIPRSFDENSFVMDWEAQKGASVPTHFHRHSDEHFTVTKGEVTFTVNGENILKREGETLFVPKMTPHSIKNKSNNTIGLRVVYVPCADTHKMFGCWATLQDEGNSMMAVFMKWWFIQQKLGWRKFSEPADGGGRVMFSVIGGLAMLLGNLLGWKKYLKDFLKL